MNPDTKSVSARLEKLRADIARLAAEFGRDPADITVLAVSKTKPVEMLREALAAGQQAFGENYLQDALPKIEALRGSGAEWHFIGAIQSNKTREIAENFDWVQTVDREKIIRRLDEQRPGTLPPLQICLQVNIDDESQKAGASPDALHDLATAIVAAERLQLRGLMAIPRHSDDVDEQRASFARLRECFEKLQREFPAMDTLSMGMSGDIPAAIAEGSSMLRVGTAIFGPR